MIKNLILILFTVTFALSAMAEDINIDGAPEPAAPPAAEGKATTEGPASAVTPDREPARKKKRRRHRRRRHHRRNR